MSRYKCIYDEYNACIDIEVCREGASSICMLGSGGAQRECNYLPQNIDAQMCLPVFLGIGMGHAYNKFRTKYPQSPVAVIDKENDLWEAAGINIEDENTLIINQDDKESVLGILTKWQERHGGKPFLPIVHLFYQRLDKYFYGELREKLAASQKFDIWNKARSPRFRNKTIKLLLVVRNYFLFDEIGIACKHLGIEYQFIHVDSPLLGTHEFIEQLLKEVLLFKPDAMLTINHAGVDCEGVLVDLLEKLELPLISWFFDNPQSILSMYSGLPSPWLNIFTWDKDSIPALKSQGFESTYYLPLGTNPERFHPSKKHVRVPQSWKRDISFVGTSMCSKVGKIWEEVHFPQEHLEIFLRLGDEFAEDDGKSIVKFIENQTNPAYQTLIQFYNDIGKEEKHKFEAGLIFEATRIYRLDCVKQLLDFDPLIVGDEGWKDLLNHEKRQWIWHQSICYYTALPFFYTHSKINFNCTSMQMKGASNQRVLDVPAAGAFVLSDWREQMEDMFDEKTEVVCFREKEEIPDLIRYYLKHDKERERIVLAARKRILSCHTWEKRVEEIVRVMQEKYGK